MDVAMLVQWRLIVSSAEWRLVSKALRGVLTDEEKIEALALQEKMMRERAIQAEQLSKEADKAIRNIEESK